MENMSMAPFFLKKARFGYRMGTDKIEDHSVNAGLWDIVNNFHMGISNELCSERYHVSREDQDRYAAESYRRTLDAASKGKFAEEIVPVKIKGKKGETILFDKDECPRETSIEVLSKMKSAFKEGGVTTAGNASVISDGAAAVVVMEKEKAKKEGGQVLASLGAQASFGIHMNYVLA